MPRKLAGREGYEVEAHGRVLQGRPAGRQSGARAAQTLTLI
jgi:hypothetical protein